MSCNNSNLKGRQRVTNIVNSNYLEFVVGPRNDIGVLLGERIEAKVGVLQQHKWIIINPRIPIDLEVSDRRAAIKDWVLPLNGDGDVGES